MKRSIQFFALVIIMAGVAIWFVSTDNISNSLEYANSPPGSSQNNKNNQADRDSAAEEVRAVATKISNIEQTLEEYYAANRREQDNLRAEFMTMIDQVQSSIENLSQANSVEHLTATVNQNSVRLSQLELANNSDGANDQAPGSSSRFIWFTSIGSEAMPTSLYPYPETNSEFLANSNTGFPEASEEILSNSIAQNTPQYTIPPTTTLLDAIALTALVGRVPVNGRLEDPWRFKIITSSENLAANGHRIPELAGMLWSGTARGDLALSCISGNIDTATFIFEDGTIQTIKNKGGSENASQGIGWISDEYGNPCISGELKSNAFQSLSRSTALNTLGATASALAQAQTTSEQSSSGDSMIQSVTGNIDNFVLGRAAEEAIQETNRWLQSRQQNSFDAIYLPAGRAVAIHIESTITIENDPTARKIKKFDDSSQANLQLGGFD